MFGNIAIFCILGTFVEGLSSVRQSDSNNSSMRPTLSPENEKCQSLCGSNNMSDCGRFGSYCKPFGPPEDGVGVCQGFYYLPDNTTCFFNTNPDPAVCPEDRPVFCGGNTTTTPAPTSTPEPGPTTTTEPGPTTTTEPGPTTTTEPGPTTTTEPGPTTTTEPGPTTTTEPGPTTTTTEPGPTTTPEPGPTTTTPAPTSTPEPGPTTTAAPSPGHPTGTFVGNTSLGAVTVAVTALFAETETVIQELNVTLTGLNLQLQNIPYNMEGSKINITDFSAIPETYRALIEGASLTYDSSAETITFSIPAPPLSVALHKQSSLRNMLRRQ